MTGQVASEYPVPMVFYFKIRIFSVFYRAIFVQTLQSLALQHEFPFPEPKKTP